MVGVACSTLNTCVKDTDTESTCITDTCAKRACTGGACTDNTCAKGICTGVASDKDACIGSIYAIEHLEIHLQSFQILEVGGVG